MVRFAVSRDLHTVTSHNTFRIFLVLLRAPFQGEDSFNCLQCMFVLAIMNACLRELCRKRVRAF